MSTSYAPFKTKFGVYIYVHIFLVHILFCSYIIFSGANSFVFKELCGILFVLAKSLIVLQYK